MICYDSISLALHVCLLVHTVSVMASMRELALRPHALQQAALHVLGPGRVAEGGGPGGGWGQRQQPWQCKGA